MDDPSDIPGTTGEITLICPQCQNPTPKFYYNLGKRVGHCKHCDWAGPHPAMQVPPAAPIYQSPVEPDRDRLTPAYVAACEANLWTNKYKDALTYLLVTRGFKTETIKHYHWGYDAYQHAITIPRYDDQGGVVGVKYRHMHPDAPQRYTSARGSRSTLYNRESLEGSLVPEVIITEGEFDTAAVYQSMTRVPVVGCPGMGTFKDQWIKSFDDFTKIYIAFDHEESADERAIQLADKLKSHRCYRLKLPDKIKDLNQLLVQAGNSTPGILTQLMQEAKCIGSPLTKETHEYIDEAVKSYNEGDKLQISTGYPALDWCFGGFAPGRVYLVKGNTKLGKTTFLMDLIINMATKDHKCIIGSFEMKPAQEMLLKIVSKLLGKDIEAPPRLDPAQFRRALDLVSSWPTLTWVNRHDHVRLGELYDAVKSKYAEGFRILLLDHIQFLMNLGSDKEGAVFSQTARVSKFVKKLTNDFPELVIIAITELNANEGTMGGKSLEYDGDVILKYYGTGLTCEHHRMGAGKYRDRTVQIRWHPETYSYSVWNNEPAATPSLVGSSTYASGGVS